MYHLKQHTFTCCHSLYVYLLSSGTCCLEIKTVKEIDHGSKSKWEFSEASSIRIYTSHIKLAVCRLLRLSKAGFVCMLLAVK